MNQTTLWHDTFLDAIGSAVQAAGGIKRVATKLWPTLDASSATARLRGCLNPDHQQKLDPDELVAIARLAKEAGDSSVMEFLARTLGYEIKPLAPAEARKVARLARIEYLHEELGRLIHEVDE